MSSDGNAFLERWHRIVTERDAAGLDAVLADDITMGAPPYWTKLETRQVVHRLLSIIIQTIDGFTYHREWIRGRELALEFTGKVGDLNLQGIDIITLNDEGKIQNLDVMIRPMNALSKLATIVREKMMAAA
jgi:hypothetical protein